MSDEITRIEDQLRRAMEGEAWHGPSVLEALAGVSARQAYAHPIAGAHSIWELVLHLGGTYRVVLRRMRGGAPALTPDEDWPEVPEPTESNWRDTVSELRGLNEEARRVVARFDPGRLDEPLVPAPPYTAWVQFVGITQHDVYHAGQIVLLKRALGA